MNVRSVLSDLRGAAQLACDATLGITGAVERMHATVLHLPLPLGRMKKTPDAGLARLVYGSIRGTTRLVDGAVGLATQPFIRAPIDAAPWPERDAALAALNGVCGDHLARTGNPLAISMSLRFDAPLLSAGAEQPRRWLILVHGLCMNDRQWHRPGDDQMPAHDHGAALARDLGLVPVYLRYNTGLGIADNGVLLAEQMERFVAEQLNDSDELLMLGYSLGGLVIRRALAAAHLAGHRWSETLRKLVFLGTPHTGAPLAQGGHGVDRALDLSPYSSAFARLARARSQGLQDLRQGAGADLTEIPQGVESYLLAGCLAERPGGGVGNLLGDGLVPVASALSQRRGRPRAVPGARQWQAQGVGHLALLRDPAVYGKLRDWLG